MEKIIITEQEIMSARDYMPIAEKVAFISNITWDCLRSFDTVTDINRTPVKCYKEAHYRKSIWLMTALFKFYFGSEKASEIKESITVEEYDNYCASHIFNQFERLKAKGGDLRDKIFDILFDYRDLERRLNTEVYHTLAAVNGTVVQALDQIEIGTTPEKVEEMSKQLAEVKEQAEALQKKAKAVKA